MKKRIFGVFIFLLFLAGGGTAIFLWRSGKLSFKQETIYIAVAGPMSGQYQSESQSMLAGIRLALEHLRQQGGLPGKNIELLLYDDQDDPQLAATAATQIIQDNKALLVLGHFNSGASTAAGEVYKKSEIPAITASATAEAVTRGNMWYFRIVPNNQIQANFVANYLKYCLRKDDVGIVYIDDGYGQSLFTNFEYTAQKIGLRVVKRWGIQSAAQTDQDAQVEKIIAEMRTLNPAPQAIFLATYSREAAQIIAALRQTEQKYLWIGADDISSAWFLQDINAYPGEQAAAGTYSDGVYGTSPFLIELAGEQGDVFARDFERQYHKRPTWYEAYYYDAMQVAIEAIKRADLQGTGHLYNDRKKLREALLQFYNEDTAIDGVTGKIFFNETGDVIRPYAIGYYQRQRFLPAYTQYYPIPEPEDRETLFAKVQQGNLILINGQFMDKRAIVNTGVKIHNISQLDVEQSTYTVDFSIWFRFQDDFRDAQIALENTVGPVTLGQPVFDARENDITTRIYRVKATFQGQFDFRSYPFDQHELRISFHHAELPLEKLGYISNPLDTPASLRDGADEQPSFCGADTWKMSNTLMYQDSLAKQTTFGVPTYFRTPQTIQYSRFNTTIRIERVNRSGFIIQAIPTLMLIVGIFALHLLPPKRFSVRLLCEIAALFANLYYQRQFTAILAVEYLTQFEYVILGVYGLIFLSMMLSLSQYRRYRRRLALVEGMQLFEALPEKLKLAISKKIHRRNIRKLGKTIFRQGEPGVSIFLILRGEVSLEKAHANGDVQEVAHRADGEWIGEQALLNEATRSVSAVSATPVSLGELTAADLFAALKKYPDELEQMKQKAEHLRPH